MDLHFPSCYNPAAGLTNYKNNMAFPTSAGSGKHNCPPGWIHVPHIFYEVYWNTPAFLSRWTPNHGSQPFIFSNGDRTGYSIHGDFIAGWDETVLQHIIDTCDAGDSGMDKCPGVTAYSSSLNCNIPCPVSEPITGSLSSLPGKNPPSGWGVGPNPPVAALVASSSASKSPIANTQVATGPSSSAPAAGNPAPPSDSTSAAASPGTPKTTPSPTIAQAPASDSTSSTVIETVTIFKTTTFLKAGPTGTPAPTSAAVNTTHMPDIAGYKYIGCYQDGRPRVLSGEIRPQLGLMTNTLCVNHCSAKGFSMAGTESGVSCYCGNELVGSTELDDSKCHMPCAGDAQEVCGGRWSLTVYKGTPASHKVKRHIHNHAFHHIRGASGGRR
jgi:hypothetical protein